MSYVMRHSTEGGNHADISCTGCLPGGTRTEMKLTSRIAPLLFLLLTFSGIPSLRAESTPAQPKVCLVLSGGGARGAAHIGVLKILEREGIPIDLIVGTSIGAMVGGLYSLGYKAGEIERIFMGEDWAGVFSNLPDISLDPLLARDKSRYQGEIHFNGWAPELPTGLIAGQRLTEILDRLTTDRIMAAGFDFDRLPIPFRAVATNLVNGERVVFHDGPITEALRASSAIPFLFAPVEKGPMMLADGGLVDNLPTDVARELGATLVIVVDVTSPLLEKQQIRTFLEVVDQSISLQMRRDVIANLKLADIVLRPDLELHTATDYAKLRDIIQIGAKTAESMLGELKAKVAAAGAGARTSQASSPARAKVASISIAGLAQVTAAQVRQELKTRVGQPLDVAALVEDLRRLYATGLFELADYELKKTVDGEYALTFKVRESAMRIIGGAIRYDRDHGFVALAEIKARQIFHTPSTVVASSQFGGLDHDSLKLHYIPFAGRPVLFVAPEIHYDRREHREFSDGHLTDKYLEKRTGAQMMIGTSFRRFEFGIGYLEERVSVTGGSVEFPGALYLRGVRWNLERNSLDSQDFPSRGGRLSMQLDWKLTALASSYSYGRHAADGSHYFPLTDTSNLKVYGSLGHSRGSMPAIENFHAGGFNYAHGGSMQVLGFDYDEMSARQMWIAGAAYRYRWLARPFGFARRIFISGYYNAAGVSPQSRLPYNFDVFHGGGAEISMDTLIGPLRAAAGWGEGGRFHFYLSLGPSF
jgi:NTE family protein